jgi:hypothetical protein
MNMKTARQVHRLAVGFGVVWALAGCGAVDDGNEELGETTSAISGGSAAGGVGVVLLLI